MSISKYQTFQSKVIDMEIRIKENEEVTIVGIRGRYAPYVVIVGIDGGAVCRIDANRDSKPKQSSDKKV